MASPTTSPTTIAAIKGLAIATSFITTGSLVTLSFISIPTILQHAESDAATAQTASEQFSIAYTVGKGLFPPGEFFSTAAFGFLAWHYRQNTSLQSWKLYAGAAVAMFSVVPWTIGFMEKTSLKMVTLSRAKAKAAEKDKRPKLVHTKSEGLSGDLLSVPGSDAQEQPMTPSDEFEPFEDSPFSTEEYELEKVKKMLRQWNFRNQVRTIGPLVAGALGLWAALE